MQGKSVVVFYGSQTGTAEEFAGRLAKDSARYGLKAMVADPEECDMVSHAMDLLCQTSGSQIGRVYGIFELRF